MTHSSMIYVFKQVLDHHTEAIEEVQVHLNIHVEYLPRDPLTGRHYCLKM
jgi:hypothetical protein